MQNLDFYWWSDPVVSSVELSCRSCCVVSFFVICCAFLDGFAHGKRLKFDFKVPNSDPGWCFKFHAKIVEFLLATASVQLS